MMPKHLARRLSLLLTLGCLSTAAQADSYHYNNVLIGDRASGMGGAYTAVADDPSGLYYNPSGIVYTAGSNLSASMNAFNLRRSTYKNVLGENNWVRSSNVLLPNFFGVTQPLGPGYAGFSYAVTDAVLEDQDQIMPDFPNPGATYTINFNNQDNTYNIGPSFALAIGERFSIGITLYAHYRQQELIFNQVFTHLTDPQYQLNPDGTRIVDPGEPDYGFTVDRDGNNDVIMLDTEHWEDSYTAVTEYGIRPMLGMMWSPIDKLSIGATIAKTELLHAETVTHKSCYTTDWNGMSTELDGNGDEQITGLCRIGEIRTQRQVSNYQRRFPLNINLGLAYFPTSRLLLSGKMAIYEALFDQAQPLVNLAAGMEYYFTGQWAMRMGMFSDFSNTPQLEKGKVNNYTEHVDLYGGSFSLTRFTRSSSITVGLSSSYGKGEAQVITGNAAIQDVEVLNVTAYLSTSYSY